MKIQRHIWENAQKHELQYHVHSPRSESWYSEFFYNYFRILGCNTEEFQQKSIIEVGPAFYPGLSYYSARKKVCVEPTYNEFGEEVKKRYQDSNIELILKPLEEVEHFELEEKFDELWMLNFLQHVIDPELCISQAKRFAKVIRFFEPINTPTDVCHPHAFDIRYFQNAFSHDTVSYYAGKRDPLFVDGFHEAECAYGSFYT